ncbi:MAG: DUF2007 domain-containing protein [Steroidobacteraceae bacterium]
MRTVFEPSNALEGHMLQDLLKQRGITSRLDGAQLQGGVGELPAAGFVRLVVDDEDYESARVVVDEWESTAGPDPVPAPTARASRGFVAALVGLVLGVTGSYLFFRAPVSVQGSDYNDDGRLDEHWTYSPGGALLRSEADRNFDGKKDLIIHYDAHGRVDSGENDDDFDGTFESHSQYRDGSIRYSEADTNGDSWIDLRFYFKHGVLTRIEYFLPESSSPARIEYFELGKLITAEVDTDRDGRLNLRHQYSDLAELVHTETIP